VSIPKLRTLSFLPFNPDLRLRIGSLNQTAAPRLLFLIPGRLQALSCPRPHHSPTGGSFAHPTCPVGAALIASLSMAWFNSPFLPSTQLARNWRLCPEKLVRPDLLVPLPGQLPFQALLWTDSPLPIFFFLAPRNGDSRLQGSFFFINMSTRPCCFPSSPPNVLIEFAAVSFIEFPFSARNHRESVDQ